MPCNNRFDTSKGANITKPSTDRGLKFEPTVCNCCHDVAVMPADI